MKAMLPSTEQEFTEWLKETKRSPLEYTSVEGVEILSAGTMRFLFDYIKERFGDKAEAEAIKWAQSSGSFFWKNEDSREKLFKRNPEAFDSHRINRQASRRNLLDIKRALDKEGIKFWLMLGTFLGAYRDGSIIPWDDDTDLGIYSEDSSKLIDCRGEFYKMGFDFGFDPGIATLCRGGEHTDFYAFTLEGNERIWLKFRYSADDFEALNTVRFLGRTWRILNNPERWLTYTYGKDWRTPIKDKKATHPLGEDDWRGK